MAGEKQSLVVVALGRGYEYGPSIPSHLRPFYFKPVPKDEGPVLTVAPKQTLEERFWAKVEKREGDGCWIWQAGRDKDGYGTFSIPKSERERFGLSPDSKHAQAHRVSWIMANGLIPDGLLPLHSCDTPSCVRPDHIRLGTQSENMQDRIAHGEIATKKITMTMARDIRRRLKYGKGKVTQKDMAAEYDVSVSLIQRIWTNKSHKERPGVK
jgi:hypothetical protein